MAQSIAAFLHGDRVVGSMKKEEAFFVSFFSISLLYKLFCFDDDDSDTLHLKLVLSTGS